MSRKTVVDIVADELGGPVYKRLVIEALSLSPRKQVSPSALKMKLRRATTFKQCVDVFRLAPRYSEIEHDAFLKAQSKASTIAHWKFIFKCENEHSQGSIRGILRIRDLVVAQLNKKK